MRRKEMKVNSKVKQAFAIRTKLKNTRTAAMNVKRMQFTVQVPVKIINHYYNYKSN